MFQELRRALFGRVIGSGFNLIELMIALLVVAILSTRAAPVYLGYTLDAKTIEAKMLAGSLWMAIMANALSGCGAAAAVTTGYPRAGLDSTGSTIPARWSVIASDSSAVTVDCVTGSIRPDGDLFIITGTVIDVNSIRVKLNYASANAPPSRLQCSTDSGGLFRDC